MQPGPHVSWDRRKRQPGGQTKHWHWLCHFLAVWPVQTPPISWPQFPHLYKSGARADDLLGYFQLSSMKPCMLPLVKVMFFPEEIWGGEGSAGHFVSLMPVSSLQLCSRTSGNSGLGCLSRKGVACLYSERNLKSVQWKKTGEGGEGSSGPGLGSRCWKQRQTLEYRAENSGSGQVSRTERPGKGQHQLIVIGVEPSS